MPAPQDLKAHAVEFLNIWCNEKDISKGAAYLHPSLIAYPDDMPAVEGADAFAAGWAQFLQFAPEFKMDIKEVIQDGDKAWVYSRITGLPGGTVKDSVDMGVWDDGGKIIKAKDVQRTVEL